VNLNCNYVKDHFTQRSQLLPNTFIGIFGVTAQFTFQKLFSQTIIEASNSHSRLNATYTVLTVWCWHQNICDI